MKRLKSKLDTRFIPRLLLGLALGIMDIDRLSGSAKKRRLAGCQKMFFCVTWVSDDV